jgi:hypothetical protein
MNTLSTKGSCMCGGVTFEVRGPLRDVWNCHCSRCRNWTGHHMAGTRANTDDVHIVGAVTWFRPDGQDDVGAEYGFCGRCGSSMFWRGDSRPQYITICAGTLDLPTGLRTAAAWWVAEHADYHHRVTVDEEHPHDG